MSGRPSVGVGAQSPLETATLVLFLGGLVGLGVLIAIGVVVGSILGATLPGPMENGITAILRVFPRVGEAWEPPIPSLLVWIVAGIVALVLLPLLWRLSRAGRLQDEGARWATPNELRKAGLLVADKSLALALPNQRVTDGS